MAVLLLRRVLPVPHEANANIFTFSFENIEFLNDSERSCVTVESSSIDYGGHDWVVLCSHSDRNGYLGIHLRWKSSHSPSSGVLSVKPTYQITIKNTRDPSGDETYSFSQTTTSSHDLIGEDNFISMTDLLDPANGFLDSTRKMAFVELKMIGCITSYAGLFPLPARGQMSDNLTVHCDTPVFRWAGSEWHMKLYPNKSDGRPGLYLYCLNRPRKCVYNVRYRVMINDSFSSELNYSFSDSGKHDGFGDIFTNLSLTDSDEILLSFEAEYISLSYEMRLTPRTFSINNEKLNSHKVSDPVIPNEAFMDINGKVWVVEVDIHSTRLTINIKSCVGGDIWDGLGRTEVVCISSSLHPIDGAVEFMEMLDGPLICYFSNNIKDAAYPMTFPVDTNEVFSFDMGEYGIVFRSCISI